MRADESKSVCTSCVEYETVLASYVGEGRNGIAQRNRAKDGVGRAAANDVMNQVVIRHRVRGGRWVGNGPGDPSKTCAESAAFFFTLPHSA